MDTLERLAIEADCTDLINRFAWCSDTFAYDEAVSLFVSDCTFGRADEIAHGHDGLRKFLARRATDRRTCHIVSGIVIDVIDSDRAEGKAHSLVFGHKGALAEGEEAPLVSPDSIVRYEASFVRTDAGWRFSRFHIGLNFRKVTA